MNNLGHYRTKAGLTQEELSKMTAIPESAICRAEKGVSDLPGQRWKALAVALECSVDELLDVRENWF